MKHPSREYLAKQIRLDKRNLIILRDRSSNHRANALRDKKKGQAKIIGILYSQNFSLFQAMLASFGVRTILGTTVSGVANIVVSLGAY